MQVLQPNVLAYSNDARRITEIAQEKHVMEQELMEAIVQALDDGAFVIEDYLNRNRR